MKHIKTISFVATLLFSQFVKSETYFDKQVGIIRSPDTKACLMFQLVGVTNVNNTESPWFALSQSHIGYNEIVSMLLAAKSADQLVHVSTTTASVPACGPEVLVVQMP